MRVLVCMMAVWGVNRALVSLAWNRLELGESHTDPHFPLVCRTPEQVPVVSHIHPDSPLVLDMMTQLVLEVNHIHPHALQGPGVIHTHHCSQVHDSLVQACDSLAWEQVCDS